jgi:hypothetical protein
LRRLAFDIDKFCWSCASWGWIDGVEVIVVVIGMDDCWMELIWLCAEAIAFLALRIWELIDEISVLMELISPLIWLICFYKVLRLLRLLFLLFVRLFIRLVRLEICYCNELICEVYELILEV